jgi:hypothetical protein
MGTTKNVYEILAEFENAPTKEAKINVLRNNNKPALVGILRANFHPNIKFVFDTIPQYKPDDSPPGLSYGSLDMEINRFYLFEQGNPKVPAQLTQTRKNQLLQMMLESLEAKEAQIVESTLLKKLKIKGLTKALVLEAFPDLLN